MDSDMYPNFFSVGSKVEVKSNLEGFLGSWYLATIINPPSKSNSKRSHHLWVEYETLVDEENNEKLLQECMHVSDLRPSPPPDLIDHKGVLKLYDAVDACYRDGWWCGVIVKVVGDRFLVAFENPYEEIEFSSQDLRLHLDWVDGKWISPPNKEIGNTSESIEQLETALTNVSASKIKKKSSTKQLKKESKDIEGIKRKRENAVITHCEFYSSDKGDINDSNEDNSRSNRKKLIQKFLATLEGDEGELVHDKAANQEPKGNTSASAGTYGEACVVSKMNGVTPEVEKQSIKKVDYKQDFEEKSHNWPFIKSSTIWKAVDSMDVFTRLPQTPHFSPLNEYEEHSRERLAMLLTIEFAYEVDRISRLSLDDLNDLSIINDNLDSLKEFESHGFDITGLKHIVKESELRRKRKVVESKIRELQTEKAAAENEIIELAKKMKSLEEKSEKAKMIKFLKDQELANLESIKGVILGEIESLQIDSSRDVVNLC